ncbi:hypothetical protein [Nocardioides nanhaiensis]|uniref:DUF3180 domain-containing protein n=1 Tax=Nocardioides nanhaiensis TaxID=1476871 RepID=A0ABP8VQY3_9ACTN
MTSPLETPRPGARPARDRRPSRRLAVTGVVLAGVLGWTALTVLSLAGHANTWGWGLALVVVGASWFGCRALTRDVAERRASEVDEYELAQRQRVREVGYVLALVVALVLYVVLTVAVNLADGGRPTLLERAPDLVLIGFLPAAALPSFLLAWQTRDTDDDTD